MKLVLDVAIRPAERDDLPQLEWYGHQRHLRPHIEEVLDRRERGETELLVATANEFAIGRVGIDFTRRPERAVLWSFAVIPHLQRLGVGTALVVAAEAVARSRGFALTELDVDKDNPDAQRLYERLGYGVVGEDRSRWTYVDDSGRTVVVEDDEWVLRKELP